MPPSKAQIEKGFNEVFEPFNDRQDDSIGGCCGISVLVGLAAPAWFWLGLDYPIAKAIGYGAVIWVIVTTAIGLIVLAWHSFLTRQVAKQFNNRFAIGTPRRDQALDQLRERNKQGATAASDLLQRLGVASETLDASGPSADEVLEEAISLEPTTTTPVIEPQSRPRPRRQKVRDYIPLKPEQPEKKDED